MKINHIFSELLNEDFKSQTQNFIKQGYSADIVKDYIERFKYIRDKNFKELYSDKIDIPVAKEQRNNIDSYKQFNHLETIVDYVGGQRQGVTKLEKNEQIEVDAKPIYEDDNYVVYYADTPRACIKYKGNVPYSWCVARGDASNMFYTYRFKPYQPAFYFIKNKKLTEKEFGVWNITKNVFKGQFKYPYHFFVIQVPKNLNMGDNETQQYIVTSANNDGDKQMSWNDILNKTPNFGKTNIKEILKPKPLTAEESNKIKTFQNGINDREFEKLPYESKRDYLDIYPTINKPISDRQFELLPNDLKNLYVSYGIGLSEEQYETIKNDKALLKRYIEITKRKFEEYNKNNNNRLTLNYTELLTLPDNDVKEYLNKQSTDELKKFAKGGHIEFLNKFVPQKFNYNGYIKIKNLITKARQDDENSIAALNSLIPDNYDVSFINYGETLQIEVPNINFIDNDTIQLINSAKEGWGYSYSNDYFDGWEEGLDDTYNNIIDEFVGSNPAIKNDFRLYDLSFDADTIKDILDTFNEEKDIKKEITEVYSYTQNEQIQENFKRSSNKIISIIDIEGRNRTIDINFEDFMAEFFTLPDFFSKDNFTFSNNINTMLYDILVANDLPTTYHELFDEIQLDGGLNVDYNSIYNTIENKLEEIFSKNEEFFMDKDTKKLKSEHINRLDKILKDINKNPNDKVIENEIVKIELFRDKITNDGKIYIKIFDKTNKKNREGLIDINNLANEFTTYKLFENKLTIGGVYKDLTII
jgi:hypothetical protein